MTAPAGKFQAQAKWRAADQLKVWAHKALHSGLRRGLVERQPCEICGTEPADAHHPDYDKPLAVVWLCRRHHRQVHRGGAR